ncbi:MAG: class I SAM-dependent methyltransferase [Planctomycetes bacterium]|nr:class I SAM-dependent methyltransferase [Planctomycetota bacterium]MCB9935080.1 class I SAM-dependent methyltransferase [Planctomycetota bacterium]
MEDSAAHVAYLDRYYGRQRCIYDLSRRFFLPGRDRLLRALDVRSGHHVLEMGCGTARNLLKLARMQPDARLFGIDASAEMLRTAAHQVKSAGLHDRVSLRCCLAEMADPGRTFGLDRGFDRVFFSYSFSMMPDWRGVLQAALRCLAPGGKLAIVDFWDLAGYPRPVARWVNRRLHNHRVHFEPALLARLHEQAGQGGYSLKLRSVARRWAYIAELTTS